jgi:hypothetical protein
MGILMERIHILTDLEEFEFNFGCTSEILILLSKHCPLLKKIYVQASKYVNDISVKHLLNLTRLIFLNISETLITLQGYAQLLSGLPELQNICCCYRIDPVLRNVSVCLPSVNTFMGTVATTRLVRKCPNIRQLRLTSIADDSSGLGELKNVVHLSIQQKSHRPVTFSPLIRRLGQTLTGLELFGIVTLNIDVIINYCISLEDLAIINSNVQCDVQRFNPKSAHFRSVKKFKSNADLWSI